MSKKVSNSDLVAILIPVVGILLTIVLMAMGNIWWQYSLAGIYIVGGIYGVFSGSLVPLRRFGFDLEKGDGAKKWGWFQMGIGAILLLIFWLMK